MARYDVLELENQRAQSCLNDEIKGLSIPLIGADGTLHPRVSILVMPSTEWTLLLLKTSSMRWLRIASLTYTT